MTNPLANRYLVILEAQPSNAPPTVRLRRALKLLLRSFGLKCVHLKEHAEILNAQDCVGRDPILFETQEPSKDAERGRDESRKPQ
jgi:hypothetical protein